jgi:nitrate/nitrite transport system ATP-binding protein
MRSVGLGDALEARPSALSAGMRQRVALARAFALAPPTLLLDEPFGMLDSITRAELQDLLLAVNERCPSTLMVTHDIDEALLLSDRVVVMTNGPAARIAAVLSMPFGKRRVRSRVLGHPEYASLRARLYALLEAPALSSLAAA